MKVYINDKPADVHLGEKETLKSVLDSLHQWANKQNLYILDYAVKTNEPVSEALSADDIESLNVQIGTRENLLLENLYELIQYIDNVGYFLAEHIQSKKPIAEKEKENLKAGKDWLLDAASSLANHFPKNNRVTEVLQKLEETNWTTNPENMIEDLADLKDILSNWKASLEYTLLTPEQAKSMAMDFFHSLENEVPSILEKIASDLTAGRDAYALPAMESLIRFLSEGASAIQKAKIPLQNPAAMDELLSLLDEMTLALDNQDLVTAADIIDFDIRDTLEKIRPKN